jgi:hypothetical protein
MKTMESTRYTLNTNPNLGSLDRLARLGLASVLIAIPISGVEPTAQNALMLLVAIPLVITAIIGWDPVYALFKVRSATLKARPVTAWHSDQRDNDGPNVGWLDRIGRFGLGAALLSVTLVGTADAAVLSYAALASIPIIMTGVMGWDPIYQYLGIRTATVPVRSAQPHVLEKSAEVFSLFDNDEEPQSEVERKKAA